MPKICDNFIKLEYENNTLREALELAECEILALRKQLNNSKDAMLRWKRKAKSISDEYTIDPDQPAFKLIKHQFTHSGNVIILQSIYPSTMLPGEFEMILNKTNYICGKPYDPGYADREFKIDCRGMVTIGGMWCVELRLIQSSYDF